MAKVVTARTVTAKTIAIATTRVLPTVCAIMGAGDTTEDETSLW